MYPDTFGTFGPLTLLVQYITAWYSDILYCTLVSIFSEGSLEFKMKNLRMPTVLYCTILYSTVLYHTVSPLADTHLLIKLYAWSFRQKVLCWVGGFVVDIAIIASSSRSRSDFERDLEVEV